uniref:Protein PNS1 n=1 Tax=Kwoniella dejecticola CBS 10117 TaxID=1296121 RepID=A0A1A6AA65_9TREE|nr:uncharacterized protein I303_02976 [Kwoniella dejecticola CBS 10117]OBR86954.1 hypothetical protein I303_02976 [Kwoniella dejecticola CBS 10117]
MSSEEEQQRQSRPTGASAETLKTDKAASNSPSSKSWWSSLNNKFFFFAFWLNFLAYTSLSAYAIFEYSQNYENTSGKIEDKIDQLGNQISEAVAVDDPESQDTFKLDGNTLYTFLGATGIALALSFCLLIFIRKFPGFTLWFGPCLACLLSFGMAGASLYIKAYAQAACLGVAGLVILVLLWNLKRHFVITRGLLVTANQAAHEHWSVFWTAIIGLIVAALMALWSLVTFVAVFLTFAPGHSGNLTLLLIYVVLSYLWINSVIGNITLTTMAGGPYTTWWFGTDTREKSESWFALKKSLGTSLGSIALGSLVVAFVEALVASCWILSLEWLGSNCLCVVQMLDSLVEKFNRCVFVKIGVEGFEMPYFQSAKEIIHIIKKKREDHSPSGVNMLFQDSQVRLSLNSACTACALVCALFTYIQLMVVERDSKIDNFWDWMIIIYSFLLALNTSMVLTSAVNAGVLTIVLCLDKDASPLKTRNREFYEQLRDSERYFEILPEGDRGTSKA